MTCTYKKQFWKLPKKNTGSDSSIGRELGSRQEGLGSRLALQKSAMGTMKNPSWVQCPTRSHSNYTSGDTKEEETCPSRIKFMMSMCPDHPYGLGPDCKQQHLRSSNPKLKQLTNHPIIYDFCACRKFACDRGGIRTTSRRSTGIQRRKLIKCKVGLLILQSWALICLRNDSARENSW